MKPHTLTRTGLPPVQFTGELLASQTQEPPPPEKPTYNRHWHEISLYRTKGGAFVVYLVYKSDFRHAVERHTVYSTKSMPDMIHFLTHHEAADDDGSEWYDPTEHAAPITSPERNQELQESLHDDFSVRVSKLFESMNVAETIE